MFDLIIRDGTIADGTGAPMRRGDIGVEAGRIAAVGEVRGPAKRTIDADGAIVAPGFVDIHTHYDGQVSWDSVLQPSSVNGVTSVAMGNCGVGFAPARGDKHDWLIRLLEGVEDIPGTALAEGLTWDWESFPDYLDALAKRRFSMDLGAHVPHAALRAYVMGDRGGDHREVATPGEIARMRTLTGEALDAGALGFSTSRTRLHRSADGRNIGTLAADHAELGGICQALKIANCGVIQLISDAYLSTDESLVASELAMIRALARETGRRLSFTVQQVDDAPDRWSAIMREIAAMNGEGLDVSAQVAPRPIGVILSFAMTVNPFLATPTFAEVAADPNPERRVARLALPEVKHRILEEHRKLAPSGLAQILASGFSRMFRMDNPVDYEPQACDSLAAAAARAGRDPAEFTYDVLLEEGGARLIYMPLINYANGNLDDVHGMMTSDHVLYGLSDGGAHCGTICDGSFPTTTLSLWSKGNKSGRTIAVEELVHGYTQRNARHVGWLDRGVIAPGYLADINVIELENLTLGPPRIAADLPAGGARLLQSPRGYRHTIKSGVPTFAGGEWTGATPGRLLRGEQRI